MTIFDEGAKEFVVDATDSLMLHKGEDSYLFFPDSSERISTIVDFVDDCYDEEQNDEAWLLIKLNNNTIFDSLMEQFEDEKLSIRKTRAGIREQLLNYKADIEKQLAILNELDLQS